MATSSRGPHDANLADDLVGGNGHDRDGTGSQGLLAAMRHLEQRDLLERDLDGLSFRPGFLLAGPQRDADEPIASHFGDLEPDPLAAGRDDADVVASRDVEPHG